MSAGLAIVGLLLGQALPPGQPPPRPQASSAVPGTRLLPFGDDEPARGPLGPPAPPGPRPLSPDEWRKVRLERARPSGDDGRLGPGPKDPWRAVALSAEGTLVGLIFPPLLTVGPSAGQAYTGEWTQAIVTSSIRTALLIGIVASVISFASVAGSSHVTVGQLSSAATTLDVTTVLCGIGIGATATFDMATAYSGAVRANAQWERSVLAPTGGR